MDNYTFGTSATAAAATLLDGNGEVGASRPWGWVCARDKEGFIFIGFVF